jgi:mRNA-degrading endonuclease toxin of MazEF toxin-antitoxin module
MTTADLQRGHVVLVRFIFADEKGVKRRPGLIVSADAYHRGRREAILVAITGNLERLLPGDYRILDWRACGLRVPSVVTGILRTIKQEMIAETLGSLTAVEMEAVDVQLRAIFGLDARR